MGKNSVKIEKPPSGPGFPPPPPGARPGGPGPGFGPPPPGARRPGGPGFGPPPPGARPGGPGPGPGFGPPGMRGMPFEKPADFKGSWMKLLKYCKKYIPVLVITLILSALATAIQFISPDVIKNMTAEIQKGLPSIFTDIPGTIDLNAVTRIGMTLVILYIASAVVSFSEDFIKAGMTAKISKNMRTSIAEKINRIPLRYFDKTSHSHGDVISRVNNDVDTIVSTLNQSLNGIVTAVTMFFGSTFMMFYTNWILAITTIATSLSGIFFMRLIMKKTQKYFFSQQYGLGAINGHIEEVYSGHNIIKICNASKSAKKTFDDINDTLYESAWKSQFLSGLMMPIMSFVGNIGYVAVCIIGTALTMSKIIEFPVIVAFIMYVRLFMQPLNSISQSLQVLQRTAAASERVFSFFDEEELSDESHKRTKLENIKGDVEFRNVNFSYDKKKTIISNFSAKVKAGQKVAIVGPTGAGKTTMVNLLMRFYELDGGEICIDGIPTNEITRKNLHDQFCMVLQDAWIFEGTIKDNVIFSKSGVTDDEVIAACKAAGLHHFIRTLPQGYDTILGDDANLSEGQKQLLTIARAMIRNTPLLILDEATSSVDTLAERRVQEAMDNLTRGRTSFVIAHRLSTIKNADLILVMRDGEIVESGTHSDLLSKSGFYAELYNSQFEQAS